MPISKTDYIGGCQCEKLLWLTQNRPEVLDKTDDTHTEEGKEVGAMARLYYQNAITIPLDKAPAMADMTRKVIQKGMSTTVCEATFMADGLSCAVDILRVITPSRVEIIEVKSSTDAKDIQIEDMAFQYHVVKNAGYQVDRVILMHLNKEYVRHGDIDVHKLFVQEDVTAKVAIRERSVAAEIERFKELSKLTEEPLTNICLSCDKPHECPAKAYCFKKAGIPENSVFSISGMTAKKKHELYQQGYVTLEQVRGNYTLTTKEKQKVSDMLDVDNEIKVNTTEVLRFLDTVRYPLYHLDFETFQKAVPMFEGASPYQQIPFQYSLHIQKKACGDCEHKELLTIAGKDPRRMVAERLCEDIPMGVQSIAYNFSFEKSVIRMLAGLFPDLSNHLLDIANNMIDLMVPFQKRWVYTGAMHGSYSIKAVLPALCGDDPELDYHALPVVHNGGEAMATFATLHLIEDAEEVERIRSGLLQYCGLDTLAMVKVLNKLYELVY